MEVTASSTTAEGNAVVYITDGTKTLWSWHIWVTNFDPVTTSEAYNGYTFMDRNLGAINDTPGYADALGLMYQWGRKDPFVGASSAASGTTTLKALYSGGSGDGIYNITGTTPANALAVPTTSANNQETAIRNPGIFYYKTSDPKDWYLGSSTTQNDVLWGTTKTVYDPCPYGLEGLLLRLLSAVGMLRNKVEPLLLGILIWVVFTIALPVRGILQLVIVVPTMES